MMLVRVVCGEKVLNDLCLIGRCSLIGFVPHKTKCKLWNLADCGKVNFNGLRLYFIVLKDSMSTKSIIRGHLELIMEIAARLSQ